MLALSVLAAIFVVPATAEAGILGSILSAVKPYAKVLGKIGGAVAGAALCAGFVPPLGMIAGGIGGWIVGGIITGYGTRNLTSLATLGGAAAGAMALASFGPIGYVAGALAGGFLGRTAMKLLHQADNSTTGGILFFTGDNNKIQTGGPALAPEIPVAYDSATIPVTEGTSGQAPEIAPTTDEIREADAKYQAAYDAYISATKSSNAKELEKAHQNYISAYEDYKRLTGEAPSR
jgi:hypothetical protein